MMPKDNDPKYRTKHYTDWNPQNCYYIKMDLKGKPVYLLVYSRLKNMALFIN